jgi:hypothetical protein
LPWSSQHFAVHPGKLFTHHATQYSRTIFAGYGLERRARLVQYGHAGRFDRCIPVQHGYSVAEVAVPVIRIAEIRFNVGRSYGLLLYRIYHHLKDWGMLEVYLMGVLVAIVKLADMAAITVGLGLAVSSVCCWFRSGWKW